jgi:GNAT superfamily N-acetyltransferase
MDAHVSVRFARPGDSALILEFVRALADYEHLADEVKADEQTLSRFVFGDSRAEVVFCEYDGVPAAFALFFHTFSTFAGRPGIYVEDLFVKPEFRKKGIGTLLMGFLARLAEERGCARLEWACLDWNAPSIKFYESLGARPLSEWTTYRVSGDSLSALAGRKGGAGKEGEADA